MHRLLRNIGWLLTGRGLNAVLSIIYLALATRTLGLDHFGYFAIILALGPVSYTHLTLPTILRV